MQDVTIPKAGSNANSATRILLFIIAVHYHTARPQGKPVRREAPDGLPAHTPQAVIGMRRAGLLTRLRSEAFPAQKPSGIRFGTFRFFSATRAEKKPRHTAAVTVADSHGVPSFVSRTVRPSGSSLDTFAKIANISEQSTPRSKTARTKSRFDRDGKPAATAIRSGIPRAARVKNRQSRSAQRYSSMSVSCEPIRDRSGRRQAVAPLLTEAARRSINTQASHPGNGSPHGKKRTFFRRAIGWKSFPARRQASTSSLQTAGNG